MSSRTPKIGIMQGRLSRPIDNRIQSFPVHDWKKEFSLAKKIGYECIEWVIDSSSIKINPIFSKNGRNEIIAISQSSGVEVTAVCQDALMEIPIQKNYSVATEILNKTIYACGELGIKLLEIPLVGKARIHGKNDKELIFKALTEASLLCSKLDVQIVLETDLDPNRNLKLLEQAKDLHLPVGLNYDMGNSVYWGFEPLQEISLLQQYITNVHVKDCIPVEYTVPLGTGSVDFDQVFKLLNEVGYNGDFILQAAPADKDLIIDVAKNYFTFTRKLLNGFY
jgi:L-ribulose-5-phosphate 3-epimerase